MSSRCLWDSDTDNYAEDVFMNVGAFVLVTQIWGFGGQTSQIQFCFYNELCFTCFYFCRTACSVWWQFSEAITTEEKRMGVRWTSTLDCSLSALQVYGALIWTELCMWFLHLVINKDDIQCRSDGYVHCSHFTTKHFPSIFWLGEIISVKTEASFMANKIMILWQVSCLSSKHGSLCP